MPFRPETETSKGYEQADTSNPAMSLRALLYADLARYYALQGRPGTQPNLLRFLSRMLHFRFLPNVLCRMGRAAWVNHIPLVPQLCTYFNLVLFGLEATPRCEIGPGVFFAHPVGTVVGAARVGANVTFYQGVTLGARGLDVTFSPQLRPIIGDDVVLGAGCKVLGSVELGNGAIIGANAVVLESIPARATAVGVPAKIIARG